MAAPARLGHRLIFAGWTGLWLLAIAAAFFAGEMSGAFRGAPIRLRPFMQVYTAVVGLAQVVCLGALVAGGLLFDDGKAARAAAGAFALALAALALLASFPFLVGAGPFAADSLPVKTTRVLVFAPCLLRSLGLILLALIVVERVGASRLARAVLGTLLLVDFSLSGWRWLATPYAVVARVHPLESSWPALLPWLASGAMFLWLLRRAA
jgi:hypothetical protein